MHYCFRRAWRLRLSSHTANGYTVICTKGLLFIESCSVLTQRTDWHTIKFLYNAMFRFIMISSRDPTSGWRPFHNS